MMSKNPNFYLQRMKFDDLSKILSKNIVFVVESWIHFECFICLQTAEKLKVFMVSRYLGPPEFKTIA